MYAAAGGASLASRQARRKQKQHHTSENVHQQFHKRFQQLQHQHAPACAEGYHYMRTLSSGLLSPSHLPSCTDLVGRSNPIDFSLHEQLLEGKSSTVWLEREKKSEFSPCIEIPPSFIGHGKLKFSESQRKWAKRNKMQESSFGGSSSEDIRGGLHRQYDAAANMLLYIGLCAVALGLVIAFVGTGEKGFKTVQLRLIGPMMIGCGTFCCFLRILFCFCPTKCMRKRFKHRHKHMTEGLSDAAAFNRHAFETDDKFNMEYYKHLPFHQQMGNNFLLLKQNPPILSTNKKRVSIETQKNDYMIDDVPSDSLSTLRQLSPLHEEDLIDFQQSSNSFENIPSLDSSLEFLGGQLKDDFVETKDTYSFPTKEQLQGLMSTLTFRDSMDQFADSRLTISYDDFDLHDDLKFNESNAKSKNDIRDKNEEERSGETNANQELVLSAGNLGKETLNP